ncbi:hypothetical protein V7793_31540 [Streptomyces sp. KLMMK]|uniref:hypothetical protein n=1 Tax=Streptomyces sp. KLMMK TaxID=3109353 RepID=UPI00300B4ED1
MSSGHKTMTFFVTLIGALVLTIAGLSLDWPLWVWAVLGTILVTGAVLTGRAAHGHRGPIPRELMLEPDSPLPHVERWERVVSDVALPSALDDYDFLFSATIRWCPADTSSDAPYINPGAIAVEAILERAQQITILQPPHRSSLAQHQLNGALGTMLPAHGGRVKAMAEGVALRLTDADLERLDKLATVRKDEDVWEHERNWERNKRAYLSKDVFKDTGSAVVWWMAKNDDEVERTVSLIGPLAQLTSAANNEEVPEPFRHLITPSVNAQTSVFEDIVSDEDAEEGREVSRLLTAMMDHVGMDEGERALFARRVADALAAPGPEHDDGSTAVAADAAEAIRRHFDAPQPPDESEVDDEDGI